MPFCAMFMRIKRITGTAACPMNCAVSIVDVKDGKAVLLESDKIYYDASDCVDYYAAKEEKNEDK